MHCFVGVCTAHQVHSRLGLLLITLILRKLGAQFAVRLGAGMVLCAAAWAWKLCTDSCGAFPRLPRWTPMSEVIVAISNKAIEPEIIPSESSCRCFSERHLKSNRPQPAGVWYGSKELAEHSMQGIKWCQSVVGQKIVSFPFDDFFLHRTYYAHPFSCWFQLRWARGSAVTATGAGDYPFAMDVFTFLSFDRWHGNVSFIVRKRGGSLWDTIPSGGGGSRDRLLLFSVVVVMIFLHFFFSITKQEEAGVIFLTKKRRRSIIQSKRIM